MNILTFLPYTVFFISLLVLFFSLLSFIFPALLVDLFSPNQNNIDGFESSPLTFIFIFITIVLFIFGFLYYYKKLPKKILNFVDFVQTFETSKTVTLVIGFTIIFFYIGISFNEIFINEEKQWGDFVIVKEALKIWPETNSSDVYVNEQLSRYVRMFLLSISQTVFDNIKLLPFVASILLIVVTYFFTKEITHRRFSGLISMIVVIQSYTFFTYDTIAVYENFWALFYILSLYLIYKKWYISPVSYILSIFTKAFTLGFLPMSIYFIIQTSQNKRKKLYLILSYMVALIFTLVIFSSSKSVYSEVFNLNFSEFWISFSAWSQQMRFDYLLVFSILPLTVGLFLKAKHGIKIADSIQFLLIGTILAGSVLSLSTDFYFIHPYRFIPTIVFYAIGVGIIMTKNKSFQ